MPDRFPIVVVDLAKLRDYCLNEAHPRGRHKARAFRVRLGLRGGDAEMLRQSLLDAIRTHEDEIRAAGADVYGERYVLDFTLMTAGGTAPIRSAWIVRTGEVALRLTTCFLLPEQP